MFWIELIIVLAIIFLGVRIGGTFLAMAGGIGMFIMTFILHVTPSDPLLLAAFHYNKPFRGNLKPHRGGEVNFTGKKNPGKKSPDTEFD